MKKVPIAVTGHRPEKLGGYSAATQVRLRMFAHQFLERHQDHISVCYTGMALGWDQAVAAACVDLGIPFIAAVPFKGQDLAWPLPSRIAYTNLLMAAAEVVVVCPGKYSAAKMQQRNEYMVRNARLVVALWDGTSGGTCNCVEYAQRKNVLTKNLWPEFINFCA
jgi:uncharacterized phage-like protein YoqJ